MHVKLIRHTPEPERAVDAGVQRLVGNRARCLAVVVSILSKCTV